jgi:Zn-dependent protease with chaperone function
MRSYLGWVLIVTALLTAPLPAAAAQGDEQEIQLGRMYARQLEARYKLVTDKAVTERVARIGADVAAASDRPDLPYTFKVIDIDFANALSLPGGFIYITKGMLAFIRSDHELAAILAHEVVHAAHRHQLEMIRRSNQATFWTLIIALVTRDANAALGAQMIGTGLLSGYTRELERDADLTSIGYLVKTNYTPVAALTLMERLLRDERWRPKVNLGIYQDHPHVEERVAYIGEDLRRRGIPINRRIAANYLRVGTRAVAEQGRQIGELLVNDTVVLRYADLERVQAVAARLDRFFNVDPQPFEVTGRPIDGGFGIFGSGLLLATITPADAALLNSTVIEAGVTVQAKLRWVIEQDIRSRRFNG